jgi:hypothetical protein
MLQTLSGRIDHTKRCVAGTRQVGRRPDDLLQERVERELGAQGDARVDENTQTIELPG